jgi:signal transduction histidine kinase
MVAIREGFSVKRSVNRDQLLRPAVADAIEGIAHGLRGPLANLSIMFEIVEVVRQRPAGEPDDLDSLVFHLVEQARRTGDALGYAETLVDVADFMGNAAALGSHGAGVRDVAILRQPVPSFCILGDPQLLIEAFDGLIDAAMALTVKPGEISIGTERNGSTLAIFVSFHPASCVLPEGEFAPGVHGRKLWLSRLIAIRHGGATEAARTPDGRYRLALNLPVSLR